jgi:transposase-like protein
MLEAARNLFLMDVFPEAKYQRCIVHFYRNIFSVTPKNKAAFVAKMLKAIHAQESKEASMKKAQEVSEALENMKLKEGETSFGSVNFFL